MTQELENTLIGIAREIIEKLTPYDPSHDWSHTWRVFNNAKKIALAEKGDLDVVIPAALFHDSVISPKDSPEAKEDTRRSAELVRKCLLALPEYPQEKIDLVVYAITVCSFSKGITPTTLEGKILKDADGLESVGIISLMRTNASGGTMRTPFYHPSDPFHYTDRELEPFTYSQDLVFSRLLRVPERLYTKTARTTAESRVKAIKLYLQALEDELYFSDPRVCPVIDAHRKHLRDSAPRHIGYGHE